MKEKTIPKPRWLSRPIETGATLTHVRAVLRERRLHTVCEEAQCPNRGECYAAGTATFLILGDRCSRHCRFCVVSSDPLLLPDTDEPGNVADAVKELDLSYVVITSVTRDDLSDGGAGHFVETIDAIRLGSPGTGIEVLIPDFKGSSNALAAVCDAGPVVLAHNIETVPRLYQSVRPEADYQRSLNVLSTAKELNRDIVIKSGLMLGLGETSDEIKHTLEDILSHGCSLLSLGQYLQPHPALVQVERYVSPEEFSGWEEEMLRMGFSAVASGPLVRSSYRAAQLYFTSSEKK